MPLVQKKFQDSGSIVSLFSGAGGLDIGFYKAGFDIIWANDIDRYSTETYSNIFPKHDVRVGSLLEQELPKGKDIDLVIGGPPCQGFSVAGKMDPNDPRSKHVWNFLAVVNRLQPRGFVMENVKALAVNTRWSGLIQSLEKEALKMGYKTKLMLLNASHYGVPQARERMFLIGLKEGEIIVPETLTKDNVPTLKQTLKRLPEFGSKGNDSVCTAKITPAKNPVLRKSPFAGMLFNGQGRPLNLNAPALTLPASMGGNRTPILDQNQLVNGDTESWVVEYHERLISGKKPLKRVPKSLRRLTVEEASAIQTFPESMKFSGTMTNKFKQIGNAVPPELAYNVANSMRKSLLKV